jgi:Ala-tRNA(Pro) deacylase
MPVHTQLLSLLAPVCHTLIDHAPITSAAHASIVRGTPPEIGGKTLLLKLERDFALLVLPGDARLDGKAVRRAFGIQRYRFASSEELLAHTGLTPGSVPPFGQLFGLPLYVDAELVRQPRIAFTLGVPDRSAILAMTDYLALARPDRVVSLSEVP